MDKATSEKLEFINNIKNAVLNTFPFIEKEQKINFTKKIDLLINNYQKITDKQFINNCSLILSSLKNSHTKITEIHESKKIKSSGIMSYKKYVRARKLNRDTGYLKIISWSGYLKFQGRNVADLVDEELSKIKNLPILIIDVRQNQGGSSLMAEKLAGYFVKKKTAYATVLRREESKNKLVKQKLFTYPREEFLNPKIIILTSPKCLSSNEMFIMMLKDTGRAITVGHTTGGGSGSPKFFDLKLGSQSYSLGVSTWLMFRANGQELEGRGIEPDIYIKDFRLKDIQKYEFLGTH